MIAFSAGAVFSLITLPVELNASRRARQLLQTSGMITTADEQRGVSQVLNAAALTYVAALATSLLQLTYFASLAGSPRRQAEKVEAGPNHTKPRPSGSRRPLFLSLR